MAEQGLTDLAIRKMAPDKTKRIEIWDTRLPGFGVRVFPSGIKSFVLVYRHDGRPRRMTIGRYPVMGLAEARAKALDALKVIDTGADPQAPAVSDQPERYTFAEAVRLFIALHCNRYNRPVTARDTERILNNRFVSRWARRDIKEITKTDILKVLDETVAEGLPSAANHALSAIRKFFNWCVERGMLDTSPCLGVKKPANNNSRDRVLDMQELVAVWNGADMVGYPFGPILKLLILTAQRRNEIANMQWSQLDFEAKTWTLSAELTKNGRLHVVPLTPQLERLLRSVPRFTEDHVFPARGSNPAFANFSQGKAKLDTFVRVEEWTLHDLRRSAATHMARLGVAPHVIERLLNHVSGTFGGVAGVYNRFQYLDEMRAALVLWEGALLGAVSEGVAAAR
jgi:integrase